MNYIAEESNIIYRSKYPDFSGDRSYKEFRKNWARLSQKIYSADPITCPKGQGKLKIISFIEDPEIIKNRVSTLDT